MTRVLLTDGWHDVDQQTFELDGHSFGFVEMVAVESERGGCTTALHCITGPMSSVLAVESIPTPDRPTQPPRPPAWP